MELPFLFATRAYLVYLSSFFEEAKRITSSDYIPNVSDVLRARTKTTGIYETRFTMGQLSIQYGIRLKCVKGNPNGA